MIPDKHLFIVTSSLSPAIGVFDPETRFKQTLESVKSIRKYAPDAIILLSDISVRQVEKEKFDELAKYTNINISFYGDDDLTNLSLRGMKSQAECVLLMKTIQFITNNVDMMKIMHSVKRVHKFSARTDLIDGYDIEKYNDPSLFGKFVFKKRIPSWLPMEKQKEMGSHYLLITRMFSWCTSLNVEYLQTLGRIYNAANLFGVDTEHAHYREMNKTRLVEFDTLHCQGTMASTGATETY